MHSSWKNGSVTVGSINKTASGVPVLNDGCLFAAPEKGFLLAAGVGTVDDTPRTFDNITIYEPTNKTWHYQTGTGDIPAGRDGVWDVGVQGDNRTYECRCSLGEFSS